jgi:hypothetical protein
VKAKNGGRASKAAGRIRVGITSSAVVMTRTRSRSCGHGCHALSGGPRARLIWPPLLAGGVLNAGKAITPLADRDATMIVGAAGALAIAAGLHRTQLVQQYSMAFDCGAGEPGSDVSLWQMTPIVPRGAILAVACATPGNINCSTIEAIASHAATRCKPVRISIAVAR